MTKPALDRVDVASLESFPASDSPAHGSTYPDRAPAAAPTVSANDSGQTESIWMSTPVPDFAVPPLPATARDPDVLVVGAGISGLSVARALRARGVDVMVLDHGPVGGGQTARTSAHLSSALDDRFYLLQKHFGAAGAKLAAASHTEAIAEIERTVQALGIACDFRRVDGYLFTDDDARGQAELERELPAAQAAGLDASYEARAPLPFDTGRCLKFAGQAEFHPLAYIRGLAESFVTTGGTIHTGVSVTKIAGGERPAATLADGRVIHARAIVDATGMGISSRFDIPIRCAAYRSYVIGVVMPAGDVPHALYWDTEEPYHYLRMTTGADGQEVLLVGGGDHRVGQGNPDEAWAALELWVRARFPMAGNVVTRWSGQISEPADALALIGALPGHPGVFIVTGDSGNGLTHGVIAGMILPALIEGEPHPWAELYAPARSKLHGLGTLLHEAIVSNVPFRDWISPADVGSVDEIEPGTGATVRRGVHLLAVYRDDAGTCHAFSARCPHLEGAVRWNAGEKSWDCPVHGSRFDAHGVVMNGPCAVDLPSAEMPTKT